jgi:hypothetical protein
MDWLDNEKKHYTLFAVIKIVIFSRGGNAHW